MQNEELLQLQTIEEQESPEQDLRNLLEAVSQRLLLDAPLDGTVSKDATREKATRILTSG